MYRFNNARCNDKSVYLKYTNNMGGTPDGV